MGIFSSYSHINDLICGGSAAVKKDGGSWEGANAMSKSICCLSFK